MSDAIPLDQLDSNALYGNKPKTAGKKIRRTVEDDSLCEVKFCTGGRLTAPPILHFYDYNMMAAQLIAELPKADNHMPLVIKILNSMVYEDFDCGDLHIEEIKEVLLNVHAKWWSPVLQGFLYFLNPDLEGEELLKKENVSYADIPIDKLVIKPLAAHIEEPINITTGGVTINFVFPRAQISGIVDEYMKIKFADQEQQFFKTKQMVKAKKIEDVPIVDLKAYEDYLAERAEWKLLLTRAQYICGIDGELLKTFDDRVEALRTNKRIGLRHFELYNKFLEEEGEFGLRDEVEFYSDILNQKVTRPFRFLTLTLIPSVDAKRHGENQISFG